MWETFAGMCGQIQDMCTVEFVDVKFIRATAMTRDTAVNLLVIIQRGTGKFEISENLSTVVTGTIRAPENLQFKQIKQPTTNSTMLETADFYKELKLRGYHYNGEFRSIQEARADGLGAKIRWNDNYVSFMDCLMQIGIVGMDSRSLMLPVGLDYIRIDPVKLKESIIEMEDYKYVVAEANKALQIIRAGGVEMQGLKANAVERRKSPGEPVLETYKFIPYQPQGTIALCDAVRIIVQLGLENGSSLKVKAVETESKGNEPILPLIQDALTDLPLITSDLTLLTDEEKELPGINIENSKLSSHKECLFVIGSNYCKDVNGLAMISESCTNDGYIVSRESEQIDITTFVDSSYKVISILPTDTETLVLIKCKPTEVKSTSVVYISLNDQEYAWIDKVKSQTANDRVYLVAQGEPLNGVIGLVNCLRKEPKTDVVCVFIDDTKAPQFDPTCSFYKDQLDKGVVVNVLRNVSKIIASYLNLQFLSSIGQLG